MSRTHMFEVLEQRKLLSASLGTDPADGSKTALFVTGTEDADQVIIVPVGNSAEVEALINGVSFGPFAPTGRIIVHGLGGDDHIQLSASISLTAELYGGAGDDQIKGGDGNDFISGDDGADLILGDGGRDVLLGQGGADTLVGNAGEDVLSSDRVGFEQFSYSVILYTMTVWTDPGLTYLERSVLIFGNGEDLNSVFSFPSETHSDGVADLLVGSAGQDLFFATAIDTVNAANSEIWYEIFVFPA